MATELSIKSRMNHTLTAASRSCVATRARQRVLLARAILPLADIAPQVATSASEVASQADKLAPGSVSAPSWVIPVAALVVTIGGAASAYLLKPGTEAAEKVFQRDAKRIGNQARAKAKQVTKRR